MERSTAARRLHNAPLSPDRNPWSSALLKIILAALLCGAAAVQAAGPLPPKSTNAHLAAPAAAATTHPLAGRWSWTLPDKSCTETLTYSAGTKGTRQGSSGEEVTQSRYDISAMPTACSAFTG